MWGCSFICFALLLYIIPCFLYLVVSELCNLRVLRILSRRGQEALNFNGHPFRALVRYSNGLLNSDLTLPDFRCLETVNVLEATDSSDPEPPDSSKAV